MDTYAAAFQRQPGGVITKSDLDYKIFNDAEGYPWCLCTGDKATNLYELGQLQIQPTTDTVAAQLWHLKKQHWPMSLLLEVLEGLEDLPWTSKVTEEAHAAASVVLKNHPEFHEDALQCRAMLYQLKVLFGTCEVVDLVARLQKKADSFCLGKPLCYGGRQLFLKEEMNVAKQMAGGPLKPEVCREIMAGSGQRFYGLDGDAQLQYALRAKDLADDKISDKYEDLLSLHSRIDLAEMRQKEEAAMDNHWKMSMCVWDYDITRVFDGCFQSDEFSRTRVHNLRAAASIQPAMLSYEERLPFAQYDLLQKQPFKQSTWMSKVCWARSFFVNAALVHNDARLVGEEALTFWAFAFAFQNPIGSSLCKMKRGKGIYRDHVEWGSGKSYRRNNLGI